MATVQKRGDSYRITVSAGYDRTGKQIRRTMTWTPPDGMTARQIDKELARQQVLFEERVAAGTSQDGNIKFQDFAEKWLAEFARRQLKAQTYSGYEKLMPRVYQAIGHLKLKDLRTGHLNAFYANLEETGIRSDLKYTCRIALLAEIKNRKLTRTSFANLAGIAACSIRAAIEGKRVNKDSAAAISTALKMKITDVFKTEQPDQLLSANTIRAYHRVISSILGRAVKWGYIQFNPAANAELPKMDSSEAAYLDEADARRLLELLHDEPIKWRTAITFDLLSGLRRGELLGLRWSDVDFDNETITISQASSYIPGKGILSDSPKNQSSIRVLKLSRSAFVLLREYQDWQEDQRVACGDFWKQTDGRILTGEDGSLIHPDSLTKWFAAFVNRSGLPKVSVHSLRHPYVKPALKNYIVIPPSIDLKAGLI